MASILRFKAEHLLKIEGLFTANFGLSETGSAVYQTLRIWAGK